MVYEASEDSYLLASVVEKYALGHVLDMGTGSGVQALAAAKRKMVKSVLAVDTDPNAVLAVKTLLKTTTHKSNTAAGAGIKKIKTVRSNLFSNVRGIFDTIVFNPPYLPNDPGVEDIALYGGKQGYEVVVSFLEKAPAFLSTDGVILLLFSSLTKKDVVEDTLWKNMLTFEEVATQHLFMEQLHVYKISKSSLRKTLEGKGVKDIHYFDKGKRGLIFTGMYRGKKVAIKTKRPSSHAERLTLEAQWLKRLAPYNIAAKLLFYDASYVVYEFIEGEFILDYLAHASARSCKIVLLKVLKQCKVLDEIGLNKEEMHRPIKHILVKGTTPRMIDFERAHPTLKSHNVTQFIAFLCGTNVRLILSPKGIHLPVKKLQRLSIEYRKDPKTFKKIISEFTSSFS